MDLATFFERDLDKLLEEVSLFENEETIWTTKEGITNCAGNLVLHLTGNLNHFIGQTLGNTGYVRNREQEFSLKNVPRIKLLSQISGVKEIIQDVLPKLSNEDLKKDFPLKIRDEILSTENMLVYLLSHLNYHLGLVNYMRRMI